MRVGIGYDIHRLIPGRTLIIGGVEIPFSKGPESHSDGDVLLHALTDALLGAIAAGDIGTHFPPSEPAWQDAPSHIFVHRAVELTRERGFTVTNIDATVLAEAPKLSPHIAAMKKTIARLLAIDETAVSVKAGTHEGCDAVGEGRAIAAHVVVLLKKA